MNNLSVELIEKIFYPLHQRDKVECLTVCRAWNQVLENTVLFKTIRLHSQGQLNNLVNKLRRDPIKCNHVQKIILEIHDIKSTELDILSILFVHIRELVFYGDLDTIYNLRFTKVLSPHPWIRTIRSIIEPSSQVFTEYLLERGTCPALTEVSLCGKAQRSGEELINLLGNAPALKTLALKKFTLSLTDLESLHDKAPLLSSLSLDNVTIDSGTLPVEIKPAGYLTKLLLVVVVTSSTDTFINFQKYATQKYPKIDNLEHAAIVESNLNLADYMIRGFIPQIQQIAPYLTTLDIPNPKYIQYAIPTLDQNNCQLKELVIGKGKWTIKDEISEVIKSKQARYIQSLSLDTIPDDIFLDFSKFSALTTLKISYERESDGERKELDIDTIMEAVGGTISTLELSHTLLLFTTPTVTKYPSLKNLKLKGAHMIINADTYISQSFPNLHTLIIDDCCWDMSSIYFGDLSLSYLELRDPIVKEQGEKILVVTLWNNEKRWYSASKVSEANPHPTGDPRNFPAIESLPYNKYVGIPYFVILCHSVYEFVLVNLLPEAE